mmetsp:Transcript_66756/g.139373  ORF Transcript_66756/g.139373 Transcript_66756/m.139373 type:complete len:91 (+) Transcript_66756:516-788(+)
MLEARRQAIAAGMAAKSAREAFEEVLASAEKQGKEIGRAVYEQVRESAAAQAEEARTLAKEATDSSPMAMTNASSPPPPTLPPPQLPRPE